MNFIRNVLNKYNYIKSTGDHSAFTKIEMQRLLRGFREPITSGFGSANIWIQAK